MGCLAGLRNAGECGLCSCTFDPVCEIVKSLSPDLDSQKQTREIVIRGAGGSLFTSPDTVGDDRAMRVVESVVCNLGHQTTDTVDSHSTVEYLSFCVLSAYRN